jgi:triacylglycerol lipase
VTEERHLWTARSGSARRRPIVAAAVLVAVALIVSSCSGAHGSASRSSKAGSSAGSAGPQLIRGDRVSPASSAEPAVPGPRPPDGKLGPVVLVPGYGGNTDMLLSLVSRLRRAGRATTLLQLPNNAMGDLHGQAQLLGAQVSRLLKAGAASVDLVGYSAGGIVVGLFVAAHPQQVRRVVTIGAPLHGTTLAGVAANLLPSQCPVACQEMVPGSEVLSSLDAAEPARTGVPWMSMWTTLDQVVRPADSARFSGAVNIALQGVCADDQVTHVDLPADPLVAALTLRGLGTGAVNAPAAGECAALRALGAS